MRTKAFVIVMCFLAAVGLLFGASSDEVAKEAIKEVIKDAYIDGVHNVGDPEVIRNGFHPDFIMFIQREGKLVKMSRDEWIERIVAGKKENPDAKRPWTTHEFRHIDVSGNAAMAALDVYKDGEIAYTDYMSLYKFEGGWKIVGKIFQSHK